MSVVPGFQHRMAAHCESGAVTAALNHAGLPITEPMVFGLSGTLFFGYFHTAMFPFPTFVLRTQPGKVRKNCRRRLNADFAVRRFRDPQRAMDELDGLLDQGVPVVVQVDFFHMTYLPEYARAHFNAHFVTVIGREPGRYLVSDSYSPGAAWLDAETLRRARFTRGPFAPRGLIFHCRGVPREPEIAWGRAIRSSIRQVAFQMLYLPIPLLGVRGMRTFARKLPDWPKYARNEDHLSHEVMMINVILEERGTGGGGFRFLYAAYLQQAAKKLANAELDAIARDMMANGDQWRALSLRAAQLGRNRELGREHLQELSAMLLERADEEARLFRRLWRAVR